MTDTPRTPRPHWAQAAAPPRNPRLIQILETLERHGTQDLGVADICKLIQFIKRSTIEQARADKKLVINQDRYITAFADNSYQREIEALQKLAVAVDFTPSLHHWVDSALTTLAQRLAREHTGAQMRDIWQRMDENGHLAYMRTINILHAQSFSGDDLPITPADIQIKRLPERTLGTFHFEGDELYAASQPVIHLDPRNIHSSPLEKAIGTIVHEGLHNTLRQLARLHHAGRLPAGHTLAKDAGIMLARIRYDAYIPSLFGEAYLADVEERLCFKHEQFAPLFHAQPGKSANWLTRLRGLFPG